MEWLSADGTVHLLFPAGNLHVLCHRRGRKQREIHHRFASECLCWILIRALGCKNNSSRPPDFSVTSLVPFLNLCSENVTLLVAWLKGILKLRRTCLDFFFSEHKKITVAQGEEWVVLICRDNDFRWLCVCKGTLIPGAVWFLSVSYSSCPGLSPHPSFQCTQRVSLLLPHLWCLSCLGVR